MLSRVGRLFKLPTIIRNMRGIEDNKEISTRDIKNSNFTLTEDDKIFLTALKSYYKGDKLLLEEYLGKSLD